MKNRVCARCGRSAVAVLLALSVLALTAAAGDVAVHRVDNQTSFTFHFGGGRGEAAVTAEKMDGFIEDMVLSRFPEGTSVHEVTGRWRNPKTGEVQKERSFVLAVECYPTAENKAKVKEIAQEYVRRHRAANASCFITIAPGVTTELHFPTPPN